MRRAASLNKVPNRQGLRSALANDTLRDVVKQAPLVVDAETSLAEAIRRMQGGATRLRASARRRPARGHLFTERTS